ncbi:dTDP-4-dehydrorhamnose 3,5-epimerase [Micromonospora sp. B11E3]|uniref:dTDP-4-dehydrorhamnose 3,5-epimerase family protein n=1 Tax=Micromonospora sp. B11E3 TaxID=3153562 RepID=UPI00325ED9A4
MTGFPPTRPPGGLLIAGAAVYTPHLFGDDRGTFLEWFRADWLAQQTGHRMDVSQANCVVTKKGAIRGVHLMSTPPGQAKYVTCVDGAVLDVIVDVRVGSPTFGHWEAVVLDDRERRGVYLAEGLGHALMGLTDSSAVVYLCSTRYGQAPEIAVDPLDPDLGIGWPSDVEPILSAKDAGAPSLREARRARLLPRYDECLRHYEDMRATRLASSG